MDNIVKTKKTWAITTFFNSQKYANKIKNYKKFRDNLAKQGIKLITVECAFSNNNFELTETDADVVVQVRSNSILWQKERLLNIALKHLPAECENVAWIDADIIFLNDNWVSEAESLLERYPIVQPFTQAVRLGRWEKLNDIIKNPSLGTAPRDGYSFYYNKTKERKICHNTEGGFAWVGKKAIFDTCGFYDLAIVGGGDWIMNSAFADFYETGDLADNWVNKIQQFVKGNIYFVEGKIVHLYHGSMHNRFYDNRYDILSDDNYTPDRDLFLNSDNCWEWSDNAPASLKKEVKKYFSLRRENNSFKLLISKRRMKRTLGQIGNITKNISPQIYYFLKKILNLK